MNSTSLVVAFLVVLALGQSAAGLAIWARHAIPRAPRIFQLLPTAPLTVSVTCALVIAWMIGTGTEEYWGAGVLAWAAVFFASEAAAWWALNAYAVYHYFRPSRRPTIEEREARARAAGGDQPTNGGQR